MCLQDVGLARVMRLEVTPITPTIGQNATIRPRADRVAVMVIDASGSHKYLQYKPQGATAAVRLGYFDGSSLAGRQGPYLIHDFPVLVQSELQTQDLGDGNTWYLMEWVYPYEITIAAGKSIGM